MVSRGGEGGLNTYSVVEGIRESYVIIADVTDSVSVTEVAHLRMTSVRCVSADRVA